MSENSQQNLFCTTCSKEGTVDNLQRCSRCKSALYCSQKCQADNWKDHKLVCTVPVTSLRNASATSNPSLLLISIEKSGWFDGMYAHTLKALRAKATITEALTNKDALSYLSTTHFTAVLITDAAIANKPRKYATLTTQLALYVKKGGGTVITGCDFSNVVHLDKVDSFFNDVWGLPWRRGNYYRTTHGLNTSAFAYDKLRNAQSILPASYSMKATCLNGVLPKDALYSPVDDAVLESLVWAPTPIQNVDESPAAFTQIGRGFFGYIGDVNAEQGSSAVSIAMCGLA